MLGYQTYTPTRVQQDTLVQRVSFLLATGLLVSAMAAFLVPVPPGMFPIVMIATFGLIFLMRAVSRKPGINVLVFYLFSVAEGSMIGPLLNYYIHNFHNGGQLVAEAFLLTAITVAGVGGYAYTSAKDFGFLGRGLFWALLALIVVGIASWFVVGLQTNIMVLGYEAIVVAVFTGFLLYDFSNIRLRYSPEDYTIAAVNVYLDFLNLFLAILRILSVLQGGGGSSNRR